MFLFISEVDNTLHVKIQWIKQQQRQTTVHNTQKRKLRTEKNKLNEKLGVF